MNNKNNTKVTIITASYNRKDTIERTIKSVLAQTYKNIEYIIIDGGSNDGTVDIIKNYAEHLAYWISEPDKNVAEAFNKGILVAKGDLVALINSDDWYENDAVETMVNQYITTTDRENTLFYGSLRMWKKDKEYVVRRFHHNFISETVIQHPTWFLSRNYYLKIGLYDDSYDIACDFEILQRMNKEGINFHNVDKVITNYQMDVGHSHSKGNTGIIEMAKIKLRYGYIDEKKYNEIFKQINNQPTIKYSFFEKVVRKTCFKLINLCNGRNIEYNTK